jgi:hypothetical protein
MFSLQQNQRTRGFNRFFPERRGVGGEVAQTMYTYVSKCKNEKKFKALYNLYLTANAVNYIMHKDPER